MTAPTVTSRYASNLTIEETPNVFGSTGAITIAPMNTTQVLTGTTTPPVTAATSFQKSLSTGTGTIDLTSLPGLETTDTISFSGLKIQHIKFQNPSTNANNITITFGGANPYNLLGSAFLFVLAPGQEILINTHNVSPTVGSGAKNIDLSGTGSQVLYVEATAG